MFEEMRITLSSIYHRGKYGEDLSQFWCVELERLREKGERNKENEVNKLQSIISRSDAFFFFSINLEKSKPFDGERFTLIGNLSPRSNLFHHSLRRCNLVFLCIRACKFKNCEFQPMKKLQIVKTCSILSTNRNGNFVQTIELILSKCLKAFMNLTQSIDKGNYP